MNSIPDGMTTYMPNPLGRVLLAEDSSAGYEFENAETGLRFEVNFGVLSLVAFCGGGKTESDVVSYLEGLLSVSRSEAEPLLVQLTKAGVLLREDSFRRLSETYRNWLESGWLPALYLLKASAQVEFADRCGRDAQEPLIRHYLEHDGSPMSCPDAWPARPSVDLPTPPVCEDGFAPEVLLRRRTRRDFREPMYLAELSSLLFSATREARAVRRYQAEHGDDPRSLLRSLFTPFEIDVVVNSVDGLSPGVYRYDLAENRLFLVREGDFSTDMVDIAHGQRFLGRSAVISLITVDFNKYQRIYQHERAYRQLLITAAEFAHGFLLEATRLDLRSFQSPAVKDTMLCDLLGRESWLEDVLYLMAFGK